MVGKFNYLEFQSETKSLIRIDFTFLMVEHLNMYSVLLYYRSREQFFDGRTSRPREQFFFFR